MKWSLREAELSDRGVLHDLIDRSANELQKGVYSSRQISAALGPVFGVDQQMIRDRTYYVVEHDGEIVGCGGWSFREALFGGRDASEAEPRRLDPELEAARVRAFFVEPAFARKGIASCIMEKCEAEIVAAGFRKAEISATLTGEPLYGNYGYETSGYYEIPLEGAPPIRVARMVKNYDARIPDA